MTATKPLIGITGDLRSDPEPMIRVKRNYVESVRRAGGVPVILPPGDPEDVPAMLAAVDGVVMTGGGDIDVRARGETLHAEASLMHADRQRFEMAVARALLARVRPGLGICLGMQVLGVAAGAPFHQHLPDAGYEGLLDHRAAHVVGVEPEARLAEIVGTDPFRVVSHHHQGLGAVPPPFRRAARSPDGVLEAMELPGDVFLMAVQWHPERDPDAPASRALFRALVAAAAGRKR